MLPHTTKRQLTQAESETLTAELNQKRDPFKYEPTYHTLTQEDLELYQKDPTFIEEERDFEKGNQ